LKLKIFDLKFDTDFYYIQRESIVDKITFNNRTFYSKFEKVDEEPSSLLLQQHLNGEITIAMPIIRGEIVDYIVLEYEREESDRFFHLIKHLLKSLNIETFYTYESSRNNHVQIFIPTDGLSLSDAYVQVENIQHTLELKSSKRCKILPNKNLPIKYNKIRLPLKKM